MAKEEYSEIPQHRYSSDGDEYLDPYIRVRPPHRSTASSLRLVLSLAIITFASLGLNIYLVLHFVTTTEATEPITKYAHLARDVAVEIKKNSSYDSINRDIQDAAWAQYALRGENGAVALDDSYTESMGLPHAMRWPWDKNKGVYAVLSSHEMHCLQSLRTTINEAYDGLPLTRDYGHTIHCIGVLLESVMCNADDTPLYTGALHAERESKAPGAGVGQFRMCRDWDKLQAWELARSACYDSSGYDPNVHSEFDKYKTCPDGSQPWKHMEEQELPP